MILLRVFSRLVGVLVCAALALLGLGVFLYCLDGLISLGSARPDRLLHLTSVRRDVGHFLTQVSKPGPNAGLALICGVVAIILGLLLLLGTLRRHRERLALLEEGSEGRLAARPRTLRELVQSLAEQATGVSGLSRPKLSLARSGTRGRLRINAARTYASDPQGTEEALIHQIEPITEPFHLRPRVRLHIGERGARVQ